jgi:hypothetical protein
MSLKSAHRPLNKKSSRLRDCSSANLSEGLLMWYEALTHVPPQYVWVIVLLVFTLIAHRMVHGKKWWSMATGIAFSVLAGWLAETLGLGWYANELFGSKWYPVLGYVGLGFVWLAVESVRDLRGPITERYEAYLAEWCARNGLGEWEAMSPEQQDELLRTRILPELEDRTRNHPNQSVVFPHHYYRSRDRRWWFVLWFLCWPVFFLDSLLNLVIIDPFNWLWHLLPSFVRCLQPFAIPSRIRNVKPLRTRAARADARRRRDAATGETVPSGDTGLWDERH